MAIFNSYVSLPEGINPMGNPPDMWISIMFPINGDSIEGNPQLLGEGWCIYGESSP